MNDEEIKEQLKLYQQSVQFWDGTQQAGEALRQEGAVDSATGLEGGDFAFLDDTTSGAGAWSLGGAGASYKPPPLSDSDSTESPSPYGGHSKKTAADGRPSHVRFGAISTTEDTFLLDEETALGAIRAGQRATKPRPQSIVPGAMDGINSATGLPSAHVQVHLWFAACLVCYFVVSLFRCFFVPLCPVCLSVCPTVRLFGFGMPVEQSFSLLVCLPFSSNPRQPSTTLDNPISSSTTFTFISPTQGCTECPTRLSQRPRNPGSRSHCTILGCGWSAVPVVLLYSPAS
jgi:hypothetical protein